MHGTIVVRSVLEKNDCAGKKKFFVSTMEEDETVHSLYRLHHGWLPPLFKLELAAVAPMDTVEVVEEFHIENPVIAGDFVTNLSDVQTRDPLCRCGTRMVSDGFDVHCPNSECALTLCARIERLGNTQFFDLDSITLDYEFMSANFGPDDYSQYCQPFKIITQGLFWGYPGGSLEKVLLSQGNHQVSLATFLVPELFDDFMMSMSTSTYLTDKARDCIKRFYGWMDETINRRDYHSAPQNNLLSRFLWSLGIESLTPAIIEAMIEYETNTATSDPAVVYAYLLTNRNDLINDFGLHPVQAAAIINEVRRRKHEFHDIFYHYALTKSDITTLFNAIM